MYLTYREGTQLLIITYFPCTFPNKKAKYSKENITQSHFQVKKFLEFLVSFVSMVEFFY